MCIISTSADECSNLRLKGRVNRKSVRVGGAVKVDFSVQHIGGKKTLHNVNLMVGLPAGTKYVGSSTLPRIHTKPLEVTSNLYWTDFTLGTKKSQIFDVKVRRLDRSLTDGSAIETLTTKSLFFCRMYDHVVLFSFFVCIRSMWISVLLRALPNSMLIFMWRINRAM